MIEVVNFGVQAGLSLARLIHSAVDIMAKCPHEAIFSRNRKARNAGNRQSRTQDRLISKGACIAIIDNLVPARVADSDVLVVMPNVTSACADIRHDAAKRGAKVKVIEYIRHGTIAYCRAGPTCPTLDRGSAHFRVANIVGAITAFNLGPQTVAKAPAKAQHADVTDLKLVLDLNTKGVIH